MTEQYGAFLICKSFWAAQMGLPVLNVTRPWRILGAPAGRHRWVVFGDLSRSASGQEPSTVTPEWHGKHLPRYQSFIQASSVPCPWAAAMPALSSPHTGHSVKVCFDRSLSFTALTIACFCPQAGCTASQTATQPM